MKLVAKAARHRLKGDEQAMMSTLADGFLILGGVYIKFLQGVLLQVPLMKQWKNEHRFDVYENVSVQPLDVHKVLQTSFPPQRLSLIADVNPEPFAAGSFGQVYMAKLTGGEKVAIKVLRPDARHRLQTDLRLLKFASRILSSGFANFNVNLRALTNDFVVATRTETDYQAEAKFASECYEIHKNSSTIIIPRTYLELCTPFIITQEYIGGISVAQLLRDNTLLKTPEAYAEVVRQATGSDMSQQLTNLGVDIYTSTLLGQASHGDPHPGNIRLLPDNKVGLLDYGIRARPSASARAYYLMLKEWWRAEYANEADPGAIFLSYIRFYSEKLYESMKVISTYASERSGRPIKLDHYIAELGNNYFRQKVSPQALKKGIDDIRNGRGAGDISVVNIINSGNRFQIFTRIQDGPLLRSLVTYNSLVTEMGYRNILANVYEHVMRYVRENLPDLEYEPAPTLSLNDALEIMSAWLDKIAQTDYELYRLISSYLNGFRDKAST